MGISLLRPLLQNLCCNSPWNYAVFWKPKHQHEMVLVLEDGFCNNLKPKDPMLSPIEDLYSEYSNKILSSTFSSSVLDGTPGQYPVELAVSEMASASHVVGKGVVGQAAFTGNAHWIYLDTLATDVFNSVLVPEYPDEWLLQFAAGIKTIVLLPILPYGVLQLGSAEMVAEDATFVAYVKDKFEADEKSDAYDWRYSLQQLPLMLTFMRNLEEPANVTMEKVTEDQNSIHAGRTEDFNLIPNQMMPMVMVQDFCNSSVRPVASTHEIVTEGELSEQSLAVMHAEPFQLSCKDYEYFLTESDISKYFHEEKLRALPNNFDRGIYGDLMNELIDFQFEESVSEPTFVGHFDRAIGGSGSSFLSFPDDCELHEAVGAALQCSSFRNTHGTSITGHNVDCHSTGDREPSYSMDVSGVESVGFPKDAEVEHLFEAVVANAFSNFDDKSCNKSNVTSSNMSSGKHLCSSKRHGQSKHSASVEEDRIPWDLLTSECISQGINTASNLSASVSSVESNISTLPGKQQKRKGYDSMNSGKLSRLSTNSKRRARPGDNQKLRPRDRQLIQDRIKELRELVPNTEKCSIDGLLDKTIKHMLFLRSVTNQADKLRHQHYKEETDEKTAEKSEANYKHQNGTSWAVELGSEQQFCPIVVKDLDQPGHMLIKMLCTDHGRFLEIADVIHRLQLTILKGVMGRGSDNSWARFIVQTSGNFHRLDIFWPLMQLLQQNQAPLSCKI